MSNVTRFRSRQILHDFAREERRQMLMHTRITPTLRELFDAEQMEQQRRGDLIVAVVCFAIVAVTLIAWLAPYVVALVSLSMP